jgi:hypothetical protein
MNLSSPQYLAFKLESSTTMQLPFGPSLRRKVHSGIGTASEPALSLESQLKLRELYEFVENSSNILNDIRDELSSLNLQRASERLEKLCLEADSWGFNSIYEVGQGLQMLLLNSNGHVPTPNFRETLDRGLATLSGLLDQCENDFRWRLATVDTLDDFNKTG